jgi:formyltetrahydrofolate deformylase
MTIYVLCLSCDDKPGIVAEVAACLRDSGCNIEESSQFNDAFSGQFFMRVVFEASNDQPFIDYFANVAEKFSMNWNVSNITTKTKTLIMVSKFDHCLNDLLYKWRTGILPIEITAVVSNHEDTQTLVEHHNLPFHYYPVTKEVKEKQEDRIRQIIEDTNSELIVMARYMQILTERFCKDYAGRVINIHHSFLPGFKGAKPYHQAYERGVKIIGATAHFATPDLDEGPIITQEIAPVNHTYTPDKMQLKGQDTENRALAHAVKLYAEKRIFLHGSRTIIL